MKTHMAAYYEGVDNTRGNFSSDTSLCNEQSGLIRKLLLTKVANCVTCPDCIYILNSAGFMLEYPDVKPTS